MDPDLKTQHKPGHLTNSKHYMLAKKILSKKNLYSQKRSKLSIKTQKPKRNWSLLFKIKIKKIW